MSSKNARKLPQLSDFPVEQVTPAVLILLEICHEQAEEIQALRDEIARLKGQKPRPRIRPSIGVASLRRRRSVEKPGDERLEVARHRRPEDLALRRADPADGHHRRASAFCVAR